MALTFERSSWHWRLRDGDGVCAMALAFYAMVFERWRWRLRDGVGVCTMALALARWRWRQVGMGFQPPIQPHLDMFANFYLLQMVF